MRRRLAHEGRISARLRHSHIRALHGVGAYEGHRFLVLEYLEGETLAERLARGRLPLAEAVRYAIEIASALASAHRVGITHGDLTPSNVMVTRAGIKLLDFGLASSPGSRRIIGGTRCYMAPEQMRRAPDPRSDIFACGLLVDEMIAGRPDTPRALQAIVRRCLARDPERRWLDAGELLRRLRALRVCRRARG
jgi:serine/threonine protein kinase